MTTNNVLPDHISYSSFTTWLDCGWKYWLTRVENIHEKQHSVWLTGGSAVHLATELWDKNPSDADGVWNTAWSTQIEEDSVNGGDPESWQFIKKEDLSWWYEEGREMLTRWIEFRNHGWKIADLNGEPLIETKFRIPIESTFVDMGVDRVMIDPEGNTVLVDLKTGASSQKHPMQLAVYAWALGKNGVKVDKAGFWEARTGNLTLWSIDHLHPEKIEDIFNGFEKARQANIFLPNFASCIRCGVISSCKWFDTQKKEKAND